MPATHEVGSKTFQQSDTGEWACRLDVSPVDVEAWLCVEQSYDGRWYWTRTRNGDIVRESRGAWSTAAVAMKCAVDAHRADVDAGRRWWMP